MTEPEDHAKSGADKGDGEPPRSRLGRILAERPEARPQLRSAVVSLLATALVAIVALGVLAIWHLRRRAQLIRDSLAPPRGRSLPGGPAGPVDEQATG